MSIRFLKLSLASPESIRSWTERILPNGKRVGKILKGDLIDYKNGLPIRDGLSCERIFGPMVSFTCTCGRFKCIETRGIHIVHDTLRSSRPILADVSRQNNGFTVKEWGEVESSLQTSSNSIKVKIDRSVPSRISKNLMYKSKKKAVAYKLVSNQKSSNRSKSIKPIESSILQPITYKQKKMLRFLSDFYYDYQSIYHSNKIETIPSFVSIFEEPYNIISARQKFVAKKFLKQQTVQYHSKKRQISKFLKHQDFSFKKIPSQLYLKDGCLFYPIDNKQTVGLKSHSSLVKNLLKPLQKFIFQIYTKFWFDLKIYSGSACRFTPSAESNQAMGWNPNNFIYEKHLFLWLSHGKKTQKIYDSFKLDPSFFSQFKIIGLYNKSQELPIIGRFLPSQTMPVILTQTEPSNKTQINFWNISHLNALNSKHGGNLNHLNYKYPLRHLQKENPFFLVEIKTKNFPNNWYKISLLQDRSYIEFLFKESKFGYFKPENFLGFHSIGSHILSINNLPKKHITLFDKKSDNQMSEQLKSAKDLKPEIKLQTQSNSKLVQSYDSQIFRSFTPNSASWFITY